MADVANYTIENNSGANVRIDLNNVFGAIQSSNSKATDLATSQCVPGMPFLNTTSNVLKIRNSNNTAFTNIGNIDQANLGLLPATGGTMTGVLQCATGAANAPSLHFGSSGTGFYQDAANIVGFGGAGNLSLKFSNNGIDFIGARSARFFDSDSSHYVALQSSGTITTNRTITLPNESGTILTSASTIPASQLSGGSITIGSTSTNLGAAATTITGLTSLSATTLSGTNVSGTNLKGTNFQDASGNNGSTAAQIQQGRAKAWVNFNGTGTVSIRDDYNVTSITDHAAGQYTVNLESGAVANSNYSVALTTESNNNALSTAGRPLIQANNRQYNTSGFRICNSNVSVQSASDPKTFCAIVLGD